MLRALSKMLKRSLRLILFILVTFYGVIHAQESNSSRVQIDYILNQFNQHEISRELAIQEVQSVFQNQTILSTDLPIKCGNPILQTLNISSNELFKSNGGNNSEIASTYTSPSGKFKFTYYTTGSDSVWTKDLDNDGIPDYVETAAIEMDLIWQKQINELGFRNPLTTISPYPIEFRKLSYYGHTEFTGKKIVINSTFVGLTDNTDPVDKTIGALKVTLAHEFKHAIQYMYNRFSGDSHNWAELDATLMEEVCYDEVNDYYNYIRSSGSLFTNPEKTVIPGSYEDITFALYFHEKFGKYFWTNVWNRIANGTPGFLDALGDELIFQGSSMKEAFSEMALWHFYSGSRNIAGFGFKDAAFYPNMRKKTVLQGSLSQFQLSQKLDLFTFNAVGIAKGSATGFINTGLLNSESSESLVFAGYKNNPTWKTIASNENDHFELLRDNLTWADADTIWFVIPNASRVSSSNYRTLTVTETNPSLFVWGDLDDNSVLNKLDIRNMMEHVLTEESLSDFDLFKVDFSLNGSLSGLDASDALAVINLKQDHFTNDSNSDFKLPELEQFRPVIAKNETFPDSLILKLQPIESAEQSDTRIQINLDYSNAAFIRSLFGAIPLDTTNFEIVNLTADSYLSSAEINWVYINNEIRFLLVNDEYIHSGPIIQLNLNRKKTINSAEFTISQIKADEIEELKFNLPNITAELPTKLGVFNENFTGLETQLPTEIRLLPAYPNPFNPETHISFELPEKMPIQLEVFSILGQQVAVLINGVQHAGKHDIQFNASSLSTGVYFIRLQSQSQQLIQKVMLIK
jgi:hypothetical protein